MSTEPTIQQIDMFEGHPRTNAWTFKNEDGEDLMVAGWALVNYGDRQEVRPIVWNGQAVVPVLGRMDMASGQVLVDPLLGQDTVTAADLASQASET